VDMDALARVRSVPLTVAGREQIRALAEGFEAEGNMAGLCAALVRLASAVHQVGEEGTNSWAAARHYAHHGLQLARQVGDPTLLVDALLACSIPFIDAPTNQLAFLAEALETTRKIGDQAREASVLHRLYQTRKGMGEHDLALLNEAVEVAKASGSQCTLGVILFSVAMSSPRRERWRIFQTAAEALSRGGDHRTAFKGYTLAATFSRLGAKKLGALYLKAVEEAEKAEDLQYLAMAYRKLYQTWKKAGEEDQAAFYRKA